MKKEIIFPTYLNQLSMFELNWSQSEAFSNSRWQYELEVAVLYKICCWSILEGIKLLWSRFRNSRKSSAMVPPPVLSLVLLSETHGDRESAQFRCSFFCFELLNFYFDNDPECWSFPLPSFEGDTVNEFWEVPIWKCFSFKIWLWYKIYKRNIWMWRYGEIWLGNWGRIELCIDWSSTFVLVLM